MDLNVQQIELEQLVPYARNARTHSESQVAQIAGSIAEFGFVNPVLIGGDNIIIAGHGRVMAAKKLGLQTVPTIKLDHLTENQRRALVIADNKIAENAGWDEELLRLELQNLADEDFDLDLLGFDDVELDDLLTSLDDDEANARTLLAQHLAFETDMEAGAAVSVLSKAPLETPTRDDVSGFSAAMEATPNPEITPSLEAEDDSEEAVAKRLATY